MTWRALVLILALEGVAHAGPRDHGWLDAAEVSDAPVSIEAAVDEHDDLGPSHRRDTTLVLAPAFTLGDRVELLLPVAVARHSETGMVPDTALAWYGVDGRYQVVASTAARALARVALVRDVAIRDFVHLELDAVGRYDVGRLRLAADAGFLAEANPGGADFALRPGVGVSWRASSSVRIGASGFGEIALGPASETWLAIGPDLSWRRDRSWLSASLGIGVHGIGLAPRLMWSLAL